MTKKLQTFLFPFTIGLLLITGFVVYNGFSDYMVTARQFYVFTLAIAFGLSACLLALFHKTKSILKIQLNRTDVMVLLLLLYLMVRALFTTGHNLRDYTLYIYLSLFLLYCPTRVLTSRYLIENKWRINSNHIVVYVLISAVFVHTITGILQYTGVLNSLNPHFRLSGLFHNPGPYAIYLVSFLPVLLLVIFGKPPKLFFRIVTILVFLLALWALYMAKSRTAWLAGTAGLLYFLWHRFSIIKYVKGVCNTRLKRLLSIVLVVGLLSFLSVKLYNVKKGSAQGRFFIWQVGADMVLDKPLFGFGINRFQVNHNNYQARYFMQNKEDSRYFLVAADEPFAFNEFIHIAVEWGLTGLFLFLLLLRPVFPFKRKQPKATTGDSDFYLSVQSSLLVIIISFFFSYSFHALPIMLNFFIFLGMASSYYAAKTKKIVLQRNQVVTASITGVGVLVLFAVFTGKQLMANVNWKKAQVLLSGGNTGLGLKLYQKAYPELDHDQYFLFNYGAVLATLGELDEGLAHLLKTENTINDVDVNHLIGDIYEKKGDLVKAVAYFEKAAHMIPHRFYPKYRLVSLYYLTGDKQKSIAMAHKILTMPVKIPSKKVDDIKKETEAFLDSL